MIDNPHGSITNLVIREELMELREVRIRLENVQQVQSQVDGLLVVVAKRTRYSSEKRLVVEHDFHVLVGETKVEKRHCTLSFGISILIIEHLQVGVDVPNMHLLKVNLRTLLLNAREPEKAQKLRHWRRIVRVYFLPFSAPFYHLLTTHKTQI